jgi:hypothetical protein
MPAAINNAGISGIRNFRTSPSVNASVFQHFPIEFVKLGAANVGGFGSGRWGVSKRPLAESMRRIDLAEFGRDEQLTVRHALKVIRNNGERAEVTTVYLESTRLYFGGWRLWFRCPRCEGRCRVLYGTWRIACRRCHRLRYLSQRETRTGRANLGMMKIVKRLDPKATCNALPSKPNGMHWSTYDRLAERYDTYDAMWSMAVMRRLGIRLR